MARITIQMGHVPRTKGRTGTHREQECVKALAPRIAQRLQARGHQVSTIGADEAAPGGDVFVALHTDGNTNKSIRGASVGYPDAEGAQLATAWKKAHQRHGWLFGYHKDNYTGKLREYYMFRKTAGYRWRFVAEHGTTTHPADCDWLFDHLGDCADAHVDAIGMVVGHPVDLEDEMRTVMDACRDPNTPEGVWCVQKDGGVLSFRGAQFRGSYPGLPPALRQGQRTFKSIRPNNRGGYDIVSDREEVYSFPL